MKIRNKHLLYFGLLAVIGLSHAMDTSVKYGSSFFLAKMNQTIQNEVEKYTSEYQQWWTSYDSSTKQFSGRVPFGPGLGDIKDPKDYTQPYLEKWFTIFKHQYLCQTQSKI